MRITKSLCEEIVSKLVEPITVKMEENRCAISSIVEKLILKECPKEILELWKLKSKYIAVRKSVRIYYLGQAGYADFSDEIPWHNSQFNVPIGEDANKIQSLENENIALRDKHCKLSKELEIAIMKLGTYNRIKEQFPEAAALLPSEIVTTIALNIQDTRNKLKDLP